MRSSIVCPFSTAPAAMMAIASHAVPMVGHSKLNQGGRVLDCEVYSQWQPCALAVDDDAFLCRRTGWLRFQMVRCFPG